MTSQNIQNSQNIFRDESTPTKNLVNDDDAYADDRKTATTRCKGCKRNKTFLLNDPF